MARVNIENSIYQDIRFSDLQRETVSIDEALGALVRAWSLAQQFYLTTVNDRLIPLDEWERQRIHPAIIKVGLAEVREKGVYVCGAEQQFAWLIQKSNAGRKSAASKAKRKSTPVDSRSTPVNGPQPLPLTLSLTQDNINTNTRGAPAALVEQPPKVNLVAHYCDAWRARYNSNPLISPKVAGQLNRMGKDFGTPKAQALITAYLNMPDSWFVKKLHDVPTLVTNINAISHFVDTGKMVTKGHIKKLEEQVDEAMGPKRKTITEILAEERQQKLLGVDNDSPD